MTPEAAKYWTRKFPFRYPEASTLIEKQVGSAIKRAVVKENAVKNRTTGGLPEMHRGPDGSARKTRIGALTDLILEKPLGTMEDYAAEMKLGVSTISSMLSEIRTQHTLVTIRKRQQPARYHIQEAAE